MAVRVMVASPASRSANVNEERRSLVHSQDAVDVNTALEASGGWNLFQFKALFWIGMCWSWSGIWTIIHIYLTKPPAETCILLNDMDDDADPLCLLLTEDNPEGAFPTSEQCNELQKVVSITGGSIVSSFPEEDLICSGKWKISFAQSLFFFGFFFGTMFLSPLCDKFGRKGMMLWGVLGMQGFGLLTMLAPNYWVFATGRFLCGFAIGGMGVAVFCYQAEVISAKNYTFLLVTSNGWFSFGCCFIALATYFIDNWRYVCLVNIICGLIPLPWIFNPVETPLWLTSVGRLGEAHEAMQEIARVNRRPEPPPIKPKDQDRVATAGRRSITGDAPVKETIFMCWK